MLTAAVIHLEALEDGQIHNATGRGVHGFWFGHWGKVAPQIADEMHGGNELPGYTLSPLMGLPRSKHGGQVEILKGRQVWFRAATLTRPFSEALLEKWLPALQRGTEIQIQNSGWQISGISLREEEHPWAGQAEYRQLAGKNLQDAHPPSRWDFRFGTPTAFHGGAGHFPFPLPHSLAGSWLRRWQAFAPVPLPDDLPELVYRHTVINAYDLRTIPLREGKRLTVGCVGNFSFRAVKMPPAARAALNLLAQYAFFAGSGHRTTQGMGLTRLKR